MLMSGDHMLAAPNPPHCEPPAPLPSLSARSVACVAAAGTTAADWSLDVAGPTLTTSGTKRHDAEDRDPGRVGD